MKYRVVILGLLATGLVASACAQSLPAQDWLMFGGNLPSTSANPQPTGITAANLAKLQLHQVQLDGAVDASAIYLHGVTVKGARHDAIFVTTTYGKTIALDAHDGRLLWEYAPADYGQLAGTRQVTNSTPVAGPDRNFIYAASPDGNIQKLAVSDGHLLWRTSITKLPLREKMDSPLKFLRGHIIAVTAGYNGDRPPYQGHVAILDAASGKLVHVWNSLCSQRTGLMDPASCPQSDSAIWGRAGAVLDPAGDIFVATGNADWNGSTDWGDAVIELNPDATRILGNYTPADTEQLNQDDLDLGSTSPVLLPGGLLAQGGKDGKIRLLSVQEIAGTAPHKDHELQIVPTPGGGMLFTQPAVWQHDGQTWMFVADNEGTQAWVLVNGKLQSKWQNTTGGTSPFEADGLLYIYGRRGGLDVYEATSGKLLTTLPCGPAHWSSPIVLQGEIFLPEGNANRRRTSGVLDIWSLPGKN